jgi:hypothetical protein
LNSKEDSDHEMLRSDGDFGGGEEEGTSALKSHSTL